MFSLNHFLMTGFRNAVGKLADYQIILNATGYFERGVLTQDDLSELAALIEAKNAPPALEEVELAPEQADLEAI